MTELENRFELTVQQLMSTVDKEGNPLSLYYFGVDEDGHVLEHHFSDDEVVDLRSVSKPILSLTVGALIDKGVLVGDSPLTLDTLVAPLLSKFFSSSAQRAAWEDVRLVHLLNNTIGHDSGFFFRKDLTDVDPSDYVAYILKRPISHTPGAHFSYSNAGPFLVSVILQEHLGRSLADLAGEHVLAKLGITADWKRYGEYTAGCTGLMLDGRDLLRLGRLLRANGEYGSTRVVSASWIAAASSISVLSPLMYDAARMFPKFGYGLGFWVCEDGTFYCDGTDGQYLIVSPKRRQVIVTTGAQPDMKPITKAMAPLVVDRF